MVVKVAALVRTNIPGQSLHKEFLNSFSAHLTKEFYTEVQHVTVDVQTDCLMLRAGSKAAMAVIQLYHNDSRCNDDNKHQYAQRIAQRLSHEIRIPEDRMELQARDRMVNNCYRVLVLFHDTRSCSGRYVEQPLY